MKYLFSILVCVILSLVSLSCADDFDEWGYVNFYIEPDTTEYYNLNLGNRGWEYFEGGNRGIIIVRNSYYDFKAYERSCVLKGCKGRLEMDTVEYANVVIVCPECKSKFLAVDGSPLDGSKATRMLYSYTTYYDGAYLYVKNNAGA